MSPDPSEPLLATGKRSTEGLGVEARPVTCGPAGVNTHGVFM